MNIFTDVEGDKLSNARMSLELIDSIKTISARIDELKKIIKRNGYDRRRKLVKRVEDLISTRMKFIYSFMDLNPHYSVDAFNPFNALDLSYDSFPHGLGDTTEEITNV